MSAEMAQTDDGTDDRMAEITTEADAMRYQGEHWREDIAIIDNEMDGLSNYVGASPHSSRHGLEGYELHFSFKYLHERATKAVKSLGFEIVSMAAESYKDDADFRVLVRRTRPSMIQERRRMDEDHYLLKSEK